MRDRAQTQWMVLVLALLTGATADLAFRYGWSGDARSVGSFETAPLPKGGDSGVCAARRHASFLCHMLRRGPLLPTAPKSATLGPGWYQEPGNSRAEG